MSTHCNKCDNQLSKLCACQGACECHRTQPMNENEKWVNETQTEPRPLPQRIIVKEFKGENLTIQVQKTLTFRPYYALIIGTPNKNNPAQLNRGIFPLHFNGKGQINDADLNLSIFEALMRDALDFARDCRQQDEDERIESQIEHENRDANHGKPRVKHTGKTQRERDKRKHSTE